MKEEVLNKLKEEVYQIEKIINNRNEKAKRLRELESNKAVQEYLAIDPDTKSKLNYITTSIDDIIANTYPRYLSDKFTKDNNGIYVYLGSFHEYWVPLSEERDDWEVEYGSPETSYRCYQNIEEKYIYSDTGKYMMQFEKEHTIIFPKNVNDIRDRERIFKEIQNEYYQIAVKDNQEKAKQMILKKYL